MAGKRRHAVSGKPRLQDTVRLSADGLAKVLGDLESRVMRAIWAIGRPTPTRAVHDRVVRSHPVASLTVITVLNKLVAKGLLRREKRDELLHFSAMMSEDEFRAKASRRVVESFLSFGPDAVTSSFVDVLAERDLEQLAELGRLVRRKLRDASRNGESGSR